MPDPYKTPVDMQDIYDEDAQKNKEFDREMGAYRRGQKNLTDEARLERIKDITAKRKQLKDNLLNAITTTTNFATDSIEDAKKFEDMRNPLNWGSNIGALGIRAIDSAIPKTPQELQAELVELKSAGAAYPALKLAKEIPMVASGIDKFDKATTAFRTNLKNKVLASIRGDQILPDGTIVKKGSQPSAIKGSGSGTVNPDQLKFFDLPTDPAGKEAFRVFSESIAKKSGYASMSDFRKNVLNKWPEKDQVQLFRQLWEGQGEGYIEHLTAKGSHMDWYWNMKGKDRHAVDNVRILYNDNLKNLKDTVEKIVYGTPQNPGLGWQGKDLKNRLIVSFEDPMRKVKKDYLKQNPGDIIIKRAGNDQIIGNLGQYLDTLYPQDPLLKKVFEEGVRKLGLTPAQFRRQVISERIGIIIENSDTLPKNTTKRKRYIKQFIDDDMADLVAQYPFLSPRKSISKAMDAPGSGVTEADYDLRSTKRASKVPPLGDPRFTKGGPFKDVTKTEQFNPRQILLDLFGPDE